MTGAAATKRRTNGWSGATCVALLIVAAGCQGYRLTGRVVAGESSSIAVVDSDDPRLAGPPVAGASVRLMLDPGSLGGEPLGTHVTSEDGRFKVPVAAFGAGSLEYELLIEVRAPNRASARTIMTLPPSGRVLLVTLAEGKDSLPPPPHDPLEDVERYMPR